MDRGNLLTTASDVRAYLAFRRLRDVLVAPLAGLLARAGVAPWAVSAAGPAAAAGAFLALPGYRGVALALLAVVVAADVLDGAVARRAGRATARGKLLDHACDALSFALLCIAPGAAGLAPLPLSLGAALACTAAVGAALLRAARREPAAFRTDPRAGLWAHVPKLPFAAAYPFALLGAPRLLEPALLLSLGTGVGVAAATLLAILTRDWRPVPPGVGARNEKSRTPVAKNV